MASPEVCGNPARASTTIRREPPSRVEISVIPVGTVQRLRDQVEARIAPEVLQPDGLFLVRAHEHAMTLALSGRTYRQRLRVAEEVGLFHLSPSLSQFIFDHDNMVETVVRSEEIAQGSPSSLSPGTLAYVHIRIIAIRNRLSRNWTMTTFSARAIEKMRATGAVDAEILALRAILEDLFVHILTVWVEFSMRGLDDNELENVGPDHNIDDLGHETKVDVVSELRADSPMSDLRMGHTQSTKGNTNSLSMSPPSPEHIYTSKGTAVGEILDDDDSGGDEDNYFDSDDDDRHCSICTEPYTDRHRAFNLTRCGHTFGKACISTWVNSTARNANSCPHCRAILCVRRPRQPIPGSHYVPHSAAEYLLSELNRAMRAFENLADLRSSLWGFDSRDAYLDDCVEGLNHRFFTGGLNWIIVPAASGEVLMLQPNEWHA